ncbi:MAG: penicillin acylase family protein [Rhodanobacteraceae bacterium]|nr:penicillin acylase family protein [Rhodanobacteraceae bacterium]
MTKRPLVTALVVALLGASPLLSAQSITAPGLKAPGSISYDAEGVPTVLAASDEDAAYLLGYGHARDRFFQMDYLRRIGSGTYAELVGPAALSNDVQLRTLGIRRSAWETYAATNPKLRGIVQAYANGVNAWLRSNPLPVEYGALETDACRAVVARRYLRHRQAADLPARIRRRHGTYRAPRRLPAGRCCWRLRRHQAVL